MIHEVKNQYISLDIGNILAYHQHKKVALTGQINTKKIIPPSLKLKVGCFQCRVCGAILKIPQTSDKIIKPFRCEESLGGCGRKTNFECLSDCSEFIDYAEIGLMKKIGKRTTNKIKVILQDDTYFQYRDMAEQGINKITVKGVIEHRIKRKKIERVIIADEIVKEEH